MIKPGDILTCYRGVEKYGLVKGHTYVVAKYDESKELVRLFCRGGGVWHKKEIFEEDSYASFFESLDRAYSNMNRTKQQIKRDGKGKFVWQSMI